MKKMLLRITGSKVHRTFAVFFILFSAIGIFSFTLKKRFPATDKDYSECVKKVDSKWGEPCDKCESYVGNKRDFSETYTVYLKNECNEKIDLKCCVQEKDKVTGWRCFTRTSMSPNDTLVAYACKSTKGKYLKWVKKAGDNEIAFPTDDEVKKEYKE